MDKEKLAQLMTDYLAGKITAEEFSTKKAETQGRGLAPSTERLVSNGTVPTKPSMSSTAKILLGLGCGIFLMLCVIAFLLFWNSPEQVAKRALPGLLKAQEEAEQKAKQEMEAELAAQKHQRERSEEIAAKNEAEAIWEDMVIAFIGVKEFVAKKTQWSNLKEIPTIWDVIESINDVNNRDGKFEFSLKRLDRISINGETSYTDGYFIRIRYDLSDVGLKSKRKLLDFKSPFSDLGFFLANKDGAPFDGRSNAVYCIIRGNP